MEHKAGCHCLGKKIKNVRTDVTVEAGGTGEWRSHLTMLGFLQHNSKTVQLRESVSPLRRYSGYERSNTGQTVDRGIDLPRSVT